MLETTEEQKPIEPPVTETPIITTPTELEKVVGDAVQAATEPMQATIADVVQQVEKVNAQLAETAAAPTPESVPVPEPTSVPVIETANPVGEEIKAVIAEAAKVQVAEEVRVQLADAVVQVASETKAQVAEELKAQTATPIEHQATPVSHINHPINNLIKSNKTQSLLTQAILIIIIIGMVTYIAVDKINGPRQLPPARGSAESQPSIFEIFDFNKQAAPMADNNYQQIVRKQTDTLEQKSISDSQMRETVCKIILRSDKVSAVIQANIETLKRASDDKNSDAEVIPQAFLAEDVAQAVMAELPEEIKTFPRVNKFIKDELTKISNYAKRELSNKN